MHTVGMIAHSEGEIQPEICRGAADGGRDAVITEGRKRRDWERNGAAGIFS